MNQWTNAKQLFQLALNVFPCRQIGWPGHFQFPLRWLSPVFGLWWILMAWNQLKPFEIVWNRLKPPVRVFFRIPSSQIIPLIRFSTRWPGHLLFPATAKLQSATPYAKQAETHAACPALKMWLRPSMEISLVQGEKNEGRNRFWRT